MSNNWCHCDFCNCEVESIFKFDSLVGDYELIEGKYFCHNCDKVVEDNETHWVDAE